VPPRNEQNDAPEEAEYGTTLTANINIDVDHNVYDLQEAKTILTKAEKIVVEDCPCRTEHHHCDAPLNVCISIDKSAEATLKTGKHAHEITLNQAMTILNKTHEAGLVHMAYASKGSTEPTSICSCCPCCCNTLRPMLQKGTHNLVLSSKHIAEDDTSKCTACGTCVKRCIFGARRLAAGELAYDASRCMGCGVCVSTCPTGAIKMVPRATEQLRK
jgi:Pyruvate/2-oxoacid:ferredoxin oxidoreductase delta subunit